MKPSIVSLVKTFGKLAIVIFMILFISQVPSALCADSPPDEYESSGIPNPLFFSRTEKANLPTSPPFLRNLMSAARQGPFMKLLALLKKDENAVHLTDSHGCRPIHHAAIGGNICAIRLLIDKGSPINVLDGRGWSPLHLAADRGHVPAVKLLIEKGAQINIRQNKYGDTPLHIASVRNRREIVAILVARGADVNASDNSGWTALHRAAWMGHEEIVEILVEKGARINAKSKTGWMPLHLACHMNQVTIAEFLVKHGASLLAKAWIGWTPLHFAAIHDEPALARLLINRGALNARDNYGRTPLHIAVGGVKTATAWFLIRKGARINVRDKRGLTPLATLLKQFGRPSREWARMARLLLRHGGTVHPARPALVSALNAYKAGNAAKNKDQYQTAIRHYSRAIKSGRLRGFIEWDARLNRCQLYTTLRMYNHALSDCNKVIEEEDVNQPWPDAYYLRGNIYLALKKYGYALDDYNKFFKIRDIEYQDPMSPKVTNVRNNRGRIYVLLARYKSAIKDYKAAIKIAPTDYQAYRNLAWLSATCPDKKYLNGRLAIDLALKAVKFKRQPSTLDTLAAAYARQGTFGLAVTTIEKAIALLKTKRGYSKRRLKNYRLRLESYRVKRAWHGPRP